MDSPQIQVARIGSPATLVRDRVTADTPQAPRGPWSTVLHVGR